MLMQMRTVVEVSYVAIVVEAFDDPVRQKPLPPLLQPIALAGGDLDASD